MPSASVIRKVLGTVQTPAPTLTDEQVGQIQRYIAILTIWNEQLNLTSVTDPLEILTRHFGEALIATQFLPPKGRLADVGSGAGFPGLALKIFQPDLQVLLIEQNAKKSAFLNELIRFLSLPNVSVHRVDYRALDPSLSPFDVITARALGSYRELTNWSLSNLSSPDGTLVLWLGEEEATKLSILPGWRFDPPAKIPDSRHRVLLVGTPTKNTPKII